MCGTCGCSDHGRNHEHGHSHGHSHDREKSTVISIEQDILQQNNLLAERNRGYFEAKIFFVSI